MRKPLLCRLGFHKPDKYIYVTVTKTHTSTRPGRTDKKFRRNYAICSRCGKLCALYQKRREVHG